MKECFGTLFFVLNFGLLIFICMLNRFFSIVLLVLVMSSCSDKKTAINPYDLNGYWEVSKVITQDGTKDFTFNEIVNYIAYDSLKGVVQKVRPQLDGSYIKATEGESFVLENENGVLRLVFSTSMANWKEEIVELNDSVFVVKNEQNKVYHYKKYQPLKIE